MCGIIATSRGIENLPHIIEFLKHRGPDATNHIEVNGVNFVHTLLSMTGPVTLQPFVSKDRTKVALFNGEIYNYKDFGDYGSDGECLLGLYDNYGTEMITHLDGEYAVIVIDFSKDLLIFSTDVFSIKPLWFAKDNGEFGLSSYESCLERLGFKNPIQIEANSTYIFKLSTLEKIERKNVYTFDLKQFKNTYDDWGKAFSNAIKKRTNNIKHGIFIGLSSGYDSGAIACELEKQKVNFAAYSIIGSEKEDTINARLERTADPRLIELKQEEFLGARERLKRNCEEYLMRIDNGEQDWLDDIINELEPLEKKLEYPLKILNEELGWYNEKSWFIDCAEVQRLRNYRDTLNARIPRLEKAIVYRKTGQVLTNDNGAIGMAYICNQGKSEGQLIYLSGSGADEIFSDYGFEGIKHFRHSTIGGKFPEDLETVFPWKNFYDNTQRAYLMKEEYVSGAHGIEGRYPFLDTQVVQEFLWLSPELKNSNYKSVLHDYLKENNYPFDEKQKVGFNCGFTSSEGEYKERISVHRTVGEAEDESLIVNFERAAARTQKRKERFVL